MDDDCLYITGGPLEGDYCQYSESPIVVDLKATVSETSGSGSGTVGSSGGGTTIDLDDEPVVIVPETDDEKSVLTKLLEFVTGQDKKEDSGKTECNLKAYPEKITITDDQNESSVTIQNMESFPVAAEFNVKRVDGFDRAPGEFSIDPGEATIQPDSESNPIKVSYLAPLLGTDDVNTKMRLVISSDRCADFEIPITVQLTKKNSLKVSALSVLGLLKSPVIPAAPGVLVAYLVGLCGIGWFAAFYLGSKNLSPFRLTGIFLLAVFVGALTAGIITVGLRAVL